MTEPTKYKCKDCKKVYDSKREYCECGCIHLPMISGEEPDPVPVVSEHLCQYKKGC